MSNNKKIIYDDEINLTNLFYNIWINKFKIAFTSIFTMLLMYGYLITKEPAEIIYKVSSHINPISSFEESDYSNYNNFIHNTDIFYKLYFINEMYIDSDSDSETSLLNMNFPKPQLLKKNFKIIDKSFLENLFIEKINEESYLKNLIKNKFVDKSNYETVSEYENEISRITSNFKISPNANNFGSSWKIESQISNLDNWKTILSLIEKNTNLSVQNYLQDNFKNSIAYHKKLNEYMFENFMIEINKKKRIIDDKEIISHINTVLESKMENKNFDRLETLFKLTPLAKDKFYAAKISLSSSNYEKIGKEISKKSLIFIAGFIGLMLGMIYVLISDKFLKKS
jgi:hypothetical protein